MDWTQILLGLISICGTIAVSIISNNNGKKADKNLSEVKKSDLRTQIMFLIIEDHDLVRDGSLPENRSDVEELFDKYTSLGGNSHIKRKVNEYFDWLEQLKLNKEVK